MTTSTTRLFSKPLLYIDPAAEDDHAALDLATSFSNAQSEPLTIVTVVPKPEWKLLGHSGRAAEVLQGVTEHAREKLESVASAARTRGARVETRLLEGNPHVELIGAAVAGQHGLGAKTMAGSLENARTAYGSMARKLLRSCPGAVLLAHPQLNKIDRVVLALGCENTADGPTDICIRTAQAAREWADFAGAPLEVVHAWHPYGEWIVGKRFPSTDPFEYAQAEKLAAETHLSETLSHLPVEIPSDHVHLKEGKPETVIPEYASNAAGDLLVLGSVARSGIKGMLLGNTAENILERVNCSVLVVKPADFVSPIQ